MRQKIVKIHATAAIAALCMITTFFASTLVSEIFGSYLIISTVKTMILYAFWFVIPLMAIAGITGNKLASNAKGGIIGKKKKRMPFIAANGVLVLMPAAVYLESLASAGRFDTTFYIVQAIELVAGFANITLMSLNLMDGLSVSRKQKEKLQV